MNKKNNPPEVKIEEHEFFGSTTRQVNKEDFIVGVFTGAFAVLFVVWLIVHLRY